MNASEIARVLGRRGGRARAVRLPTAAKARIAAMGGHARRESLEAARRIAENFRFVAAIRELRSERVAVARLRAFEGPLPGIYPGPTPRG